MSSFRAGPGQPLARGGNRKQIRFDIRSLIGKWMLTQGRLSTSKLGGRVTFLAWWAGRFSLKCC
jgi:hypothetical protein